MTVPALTAAECPLAYNPRRLECLAPGTPAPHSTRRRAERYLSQLSDSFDCACRNLLMSMLRLPGGCIAYVPISPDVMKIPVCAWFGFTGLLRYLVMWGDHPRWSRLGYLVTIRWF